MEFFVSHLERIVRRQMEQRRRAFHRHDRTADLKAYRAPAQLRRGQERHFVLAGQPLLERLMKGNVRTDRKSCPDYVFSLFDPGSRRRISLSRQGCISQRRQRHDQGLIAGGFVVRLFQLGIVLILHRQQAYEIPLVISL
ncbi:hypothetical protein D3C74_276980 [compost metagenome]